MPPPACKRLTVECKMHKWWFLDEGASQVNHNDNAGLRPSSIILCQRVVLRVVNRHHALRVQCRRSLVGDLKNGWPLSLSATFAVNPGEPEGPNTHQESPRDSSRLYSFMPSAHKTASCAWMTAAKLELSSEIQIKRMLTNSSARRRASRLSNACRREKTAATHCTDLATI